MGRQQAALLQAANQKGLVQGGIEVGQLAGGVPFAAGPKEVFLPLNGKPVVVEKLRPFGLLL